MPAASFAALESLLAHAQRQPRSVAIKVAVCGLLLALPSLVLGLFPIDDPDQRRVILEHLHGVASSRRWYDLYLIIPADPVRALVERFAGIRPWWSLPALRIGFFRPVAVLTQYFDYALYPTQLWLMHLHSVLWYFGAVWLVTLLCTRLSADPRIASIGALLYAWDDAHLQPIAWLAHRNALIGTVFAMAGLLLHHERARALCAFARVMAVRRVFSGGFSRGGKLRGDPRFPRCLHAVLGRSTLVEALARADPQRAGDLGLVRLAPQLGLRSVRLGFLPRSIQRPRELSLGAAGPLPRAAAGSVRRTVGAYGSHPGCLVDQSGRPGQVVGVAGAGHLRGAQLRSKPGARLLGAVGYQRAGRR